MSGGVVFAIMQVGYGSRQAQLLPFVVGVLTEYHENHEVLVATRISHIWNAVEGHGTGVAMLYERVDA
jgi:hypothetical protein